MKIGIMPDGLIIKCETFERIREVITTIPDDTKAIMIVDDDKKQVELSGDRAALFDTLYTLSFVFDIELI